MFNRRKNLLRSEQCKRDGHHIAEIRALNKNIRKFYTEKLYHETNCPLGGLVYSIQTKTGLINCVKSSGKINHEKVLTLNNKTYLN